MPYEADWRIRINF